MLCKEQGNFFFISFLIPGFVHADRLAIDYSTGNLYYTAVGKENIQGYIGAVHRKTHLHKTLINDLQSPRDIALYPSKGLTIFVVSYST